MINEIVDELSGTSEEYIKEYVLRATEDEILKSFFNQLDNQEENIEEPEKIVIPIRQVNYHKQYNIDNKEKISAQKKVYYQQNKERIKKRVREYNRRKNKKICDP